MIMGLWALDLSSYVGLGLRLELLRKEHCRHDVLFSASLRLCFTRIPAIAAVLCDGGGCRDSRYGSTSGNPVLYPS